MAYQLEGRLLEVCNCDVLCPCWIGEMPDNGTCDAVVAYHIDNGMIEGVDASGSDHNAIQGTFLFEPFAEGTATARREVTA